MILILKSTQNLGVTIECTRERERFGRGSLGADPRDASPPVEPSLSPERRKTTNVGRSSRCPSLGCSTLGAKLEWNIMDANDLRGIVLPLLGSDLPLIF
jgi:hypothetical protein